MGIDQESPPGAVAGHTDLAVAMACLAGLQVPARLPGMVRGPDVLGKPPSRMAGLALAGIEGRMERAPGRDRQVGPPFAVRKDHEIFTPEF